MRKLYLVGMAPPADKKRSAEPFPCGALSALVPLDPRHGVFPNLVMTPLLAALHSLQGEPELVPAFWEQVNAIVCDDSARRFNLFSKPSGGYLEVAPDVPPRLDAFDPDAELWCAFGYWTVGGLISYLLTGVPKRSEGEIESYVREFVRRAYEKRPPESDLPPTIPKTKAALSGLIHRFCAGDDTGGTVTLMLRHAIECMCTDKSKTERSLRVLRGCVPLPHNEAYQLVPFGKVHNCFMLGLDPGALEELAPPPEPLWRYMGRAIHRRLVR